MERRLGTGIAYEQPLDHSRQSPLLQRGRDYSGQTGGPQPEPTWRPLAGASANNRGQARQVFLDTFTPGGGAVQLIPSIVQTPQGAGGFDGELIAVRLGMSLPFQLTDITGANPYTSTAIDVVGLIDFGVGGVSYTAEVDWNQGTVFGIAASFIRVSARVNPDVTSGGGLAPIPIVLQASFAYGDTSNAGISSQARRTLTLPTLNGGASSAITTVPMWAVGMAISDAGAPGAPVAVAPDYTITFLENAFPIPSCIFRSTDRTNLAQQVEGHFPVPSKARFVQITNNLGVSMLKPQLIFNLAL